MPVEHQRFVPWISDTMYLCKDENRVSFTIAELTKTAHPGKKEVVYYLLLKEETKLCPMTTLDEYLKRASPMRKSDQSRTQLVVKPFQTVKVHHCKVDEINYTGGWVWKALQCSLY